MEIDDFYLPDKIDFLLGSATTVAVIVTQLPLGKDKSLITRITSMFL
jgi:hypothetical protein